MSIPSKQDLKQKYKISNKDFQVLTELPLEQEIREKGFLVKVGEAFGAEEWMWKTWAGVILAIIIIAPTVQSTFDYWKPKVVYSVGHFYDYFRHLRWPLDPSDDQWIAFVPDASLPPAGTQIPSMRSLSVGSGLFPGPAQFGPTVPIQFVSQIRYHFRERFLDVPPGQKQVSAPGEEHELLPLSQLVYSENSIGRVAHGTVPHLPYRFRVSVSDPHLTVELFQGERVIDGFPQTIRHTITSHWNSRTDFMVPIDDRRKAQIEKSLLPENCFLTYVNLVIGGDDGLIGPAILGPQIEA